MKLVPEKSWLNYITTFDSAMSSESALNVDAMRNAAQMIANYSSGRSQIARDIEKAEEAGNWEVAGCLFSVLKGKASAAGLYSELYALAKEQNGAVEKTSLPPKPLGFTHRWHPDEPIWAESEKIKEAVSRTAAHRQGFHDLAREAYKALYRREWRKAFTDISGSPVILHEDRSGWEMRDLVIQRVRDFFASADSVSPAEANLPCWVYDGSKIVRIVQQSKTLTDGTLMNFQVSGYRVLRVTHPEEIWVALPRYRG